MRLVSRSSAISISFLVGAVALTFPDVLSADRIPAYRDLLVFVVPFKHFLRERLWAGELPLWNPYVYMGTPFLASLQSGVFYPPSLLLLLPFPLGFNLFLLTHYCIAILGFWVLLRSRGLSPTAASAGAVTFALGGYLVSMLSTTNNLQAGAWAPWAVALWMRRVEHPGEHRAACDVALILVLALQILGGAPEVLLMTVFLIGGWTLYQAATEPRRLAKLLLALSATALVAGLLTSFQIAPTLEYIAQSPRRGALPYGVASCWSLEPVSLLQLVLPRMARLDALAGASRHAVSFEAAEPWVQSIYLGIVALCFVVAAAVCGRDRGFWCAMIVVFLALALGRHTPVFRTVYEVLPWGIGKFRFPAKFFFVVHFSAALLAAEGAEACVRADPRALRAVGAAAGTLLSLAMLVVFLRWRQPAAYLQSIAFLSGRFEPMTSLVPLAVSTALKARRAVVILSVLVTILVLRRSAIVGAGTFAALLAVLVAVDVASAHYRLNSSFSWNAVRSQAPFVDIAELRRSHQRMFPYQTFSDPVPDEQPKPIEGLEHWAFVREYEDAAASGPGLLWRVQLLDLPMITRVGTLGGLDGISRRSDNTLRDVLRIVPRERGLRLLRVFGTAFLIGPSALDLPGIEPLPSTRATPVFGYRVSDTAPAVYLASRLIVAGSDLEAFNRMIAPDFRPGADATVSELPAGWKDGEELGSTGDVDVLEWSPERILMRVDAAQPAFLVVNDSYFPGWEARVDETPSRIFQANALVRGVVVPAGTHVVALAYRPRSFRIGAGVTLATFAGLLAAFARRARAARLATTSEKRGRAAIEHTPSV